MVVLGIDAAWTENQPSGISLLASKDDEQCKILRLGDSYENFLEKRQHLTVKPKGSKPEITKIIKNCEALGYSVDAIAVDMPLSNELITKRRSCENEISKAYAAKGASVHSPTIDRPGVIALDLIQSLREQGYFLATKNNKVHRKAVLEVYPHTAIIEYLNLDYRYEYKVSKKNSYRNWKSLTKEERNRKLINNLNHLIVNLGKRVINIEDYLPQLNSDVHYVGWYLKGYEDMIDSLISALVGMDYLLDNVIGYGAEDGTIWVPTK